ncbi:MAG: zeta toxin family protein [Duncaniella sp.]|nr:zeta toxin family protein [Duncaniella sp.]
MTKALAPTLYIIAGCNGAGKTTASMTVLPEILDCREFVNADEIAKGLSPFNPEEVAIEAGKIMLQRIEYLMARSVTFAIETTLATRSYKELVGRAKEKGYEVVLLFFWLPSPQHAEQRVAMRVASGGHNIPKEVIHRRYWRGIQNLFDIFVHIVEQWSLYDNTSDIVPIVVNGEIRNREQLNLILESCRNRKK